jgi:hypothetical protein
VAAVFPAAPKKHMPSQRMIAGDELWLEPIPTKLRGEAVAALAERNVEGFLLLVANDHSLDLVSRNCAVLQRLGIYERALLSAFISARVNHHRWPTRDLRSLFESTDRRRLRKAGDPLPGRGPFTLYRGVAGRGAARRVRGLSWTASPERAYFFAHRFAATSFCPNPAVFRVTVRDKDILAYSNERGEEEFIVFLPPTVHPTRLQTSTRVG